MLYLSEGLYDRAWVVEHVSQDPEASDAAKVAADKALEMR